MYVKYVYVYMYKYIYKYMYRYSNIVTIQSHPVSTHTHTYIYIDLGSIPTFSAVAAGLKPNHRGGGVGQRQRTYADGGEHLESRLIFTNYQTSNPKNR